MKSQLHSSPAPAAPEDSAEAMRLCLSALADGEAASLAQACQSWRGDAEARRTWHAYHLIGDVLRSEELAHAPARDEAFLVSLRGRLASEPAVLAPEPLVRPSAGARARQTWLVPAAVAAGFVVVAGVLVVTRVSEPLAPVAVSTLAAASSPGVLRVGGSAVSTVQPSSGSAVIRDARLDEYLRAHQAARDGVAVAAPGAGVRQVEVLVPAGAAR